MSEDFETIRADWEDSITRTPFLKLLGIELAALSRGDCTLTMALRPEHLQQNGFAHAGVQATLADHACGTAAASCLRPDQTILSIEFKINLLKPAQGETLRAEAHVVRAGRRVVVVESDVLCETAGKRYLSARMLATMAVVDQADL